MELTFTYILWLICLHGVFLMLAGALVGWADAIDPPDEGLDAGWLEWTAFVLFPPLVAALALMHIVWLSKRSKRQALVGGRAPRRPVSQMR